MCPERVLCEQRRDILCSIIAISVLQVYKNAAVVIRIISTFYIDRGFGRLLTEYIKST